MVPTAGLYESLDHTVLVPSLFLILSAHKRGQGCTQPRKLKTPIKDPPQCPSPPLRKLLPLLGWLLWLCRDRTLVPASLPFMLSPPSSLHKVRVPSFSSLPTLLLIFQRPASVLLWLLTVQPHILSWQHILHNQKHLTPTLTSDLPKRRVRLDPSRNWNKTGSYH